MFKIATCQKKFKVVKTVKFCAMHKVKLSLQLHHKVQLHYEVTSLVKQTSLADRQT